MRNKLVFLFSLLTYVAFAQEQQTSFTLDQAINYALQHNYNVINAERDIEAAKKQKWETTATGLPQISANIDYQNWLKQQVSLLPGEIAGGEPGTFVPVTFGTKQNINAIATLNQKIFDGSYLVGLQSAKVFLEISENAKTKTDQEIRKMVINAYGNVLVAQEVIDITEKNRQTVQKNLNESLKYLENGLAEEEDVEQLKLTLASIEISHKNAVRSLTIAKQLFNLALGIDVNTPTQLTETLSALTLKNIDLGLLTHETTIEENIDYKIALNNKRSQELLVKLEKSRALPTLNAFVNGGYMGNNNEFKFLQKEQEWFGSSLLGVSLHIPIFSSLQRSAKTQKAKINLMKAETELTQTEQQLQLDIATAKSNYQYAIDQYNTSKQNLDLAERIEKKNQIKFFEGVSSSFDLRQAQTQLYASQQEYIQSMLNVINAKTQLETILNKIP
jgi:outer membrane protein TolC